jgi:hypothetical protein
MADFKTDDRGQTQPANRQQAQKSSEPMTDEQRSYLKTLAEQADDVFEEGLTREQAAKRIDAFRNKLNVGTA